MSRVRIPRYTARAAVVAFAAVALAAPVFAQAQPDQQGDAPQQQQQAQSQPRQQPSQQAAGETVTSADVAEAELETFAASLNDVAEINQKLQADLAASQDQAKTQQLKTDANEKMAAAIRSHGMEIERFNQISRSLKTDPELNERVLAKRRELMAAQNSTSQTPSQTGQAPSQGGQAPPERGAAGQAAGR